MSLDKPVETLTEGDLQDLVDRREAERKTIEYKRHSLSGAMTSARSSSPMSPRSPMRQVAGSSTGYRPRMGCP
jgi:hypothetical protein